MADDKISAEDYFKKYKINPKIERADLTDEMAKEILLKAAEALNERQDQIAIIESVKDGAYEVFKVLKTAGLIATLFA